MATVGNLRELSRAATQRRSTRRRWLLGLTTSLGCQASLDLTQYSFESVDTLPDASATASDSTNEAAPPDASVGQQPAFVADDACLVAPPSCSSCKPGDTRPCLGALGSCARGYEVCGQDETWGRCSVEPEPMDACDLRGDDSDCDGTPNSHCPCVDGELQQCGSQDTGACEFGQSVCDGGRWSPCNGEVPTALRDCTSAADNDCDGSADNELDDTCQCASGDTRPCPSEADGCRVAIETCTVTEDRASAAWSGCVYEDAEAGSPCDDGNDATIRDGCAQGRCVGVECLDDSHCSDTPATGVCKTVADDGAAATNTCVQCVSNADCQANADASACRDNQCVPCTVDADCNGIASGGVELHVCDAGTCVQCTGPKRAACAGGINVCDSSTRQCTPFPVGSASTCDPCVSDAHCGTTQRCALQLFGTTPLGPFCFPVATGAASNTCSLTPFAGLTASTTIDGASANLCLLRQTTCGALADFGVQACDADADCGEAGLADGLCDAGTETCSTPCNSTLDCFDGCLGGVCEL